MVVGLSADAEVMGVLLTRGLGALGLAGGVEEISGGGGAILAGLLLLLFNNGLWVV